ncbi:hypothetical protein [Rhizobium sp. Leaf341]|uniref:hypothetical protein n=1 Tax=Rhizobium sp. Leaf341 TaxID=1736344 RepID=UPI000713144C|nr:hypothetical protein [Rhizobium sp. Leaf341]KQR75777.1 hypothetical protein ASG03_19100 [Rhizobium sp. Leaf341]
MSLQTKYIIVPFKKVKGGAIVPGEMRTASNEALAERIAESMSERFAGTAAFEVLADMENGDMTSPRLLCKFGSIVDFTQEAAAA